MNNTISNHHFYKTFIPFIDENSKTAEKTMNGKKITIQRQPSNLGKEFYSYITAGGLIAIPILALAVSRKSIVSQLKATNKQFFQAINSNNSGFFNNLTQKTIIYKYNFLKKFWGVVKPLKAKREIFAKKLNRSNSFIANIYKGINNIFKTAQENAAKRKYMHVYKSFRKLESQLESQIQIITDSSKGKIKISLPKEILKNAADEFPQKFDLSKTANGKDRASEIRRVLSEIKTFLRNANSSNDDIIKKITFSCEDIFLKGESTLMSLHKTISKQGLSSQLTDDLIKDIYTNLKKYRFAEYYNNKNNLSPQIVRKIYLNQMKSSINALKGHLKENHILKSHFDTLEELVNEKSATNGMGLLEELRGLLKCSDIQTDLVKDGIRPALLKHYRPDDYIQIKKLIADLSSDIKEAQKIRKSILPASKEEIDRGGVFTKAVAIGVPAVLLENNISNSPEGKSKAKSKRNFYSFLVGSLAMMGSHYYTIQPKRMSVLYGVIAAFITSRIAERYIKN